MQWIKYRVIIFFVLFALLANTTEEFNFVIWENPEPLYLDVYRTDLWLSTWSFLAWRAESRKWFVIGIVTQQWPEAKGKSEPEWIAQEILHYKILFAIYHHQGTVHRLPNETAAWILSLSCFIVSLAQNRLNCLFHTFGQPVAPSHKL